MQVQTVLPRIVKVFWWLSVLWLAWLVWVNFLSGTSNAGPATFLFMGWPAMLVLFAKFAVTGRPGPT